MVKRTFAVLALLTVAFSCSSQDRSSESAWSAPVNGLQFQIKSASRFGRDKRGWATLEAACTIKNSGSAPAAVMCLARLYLMDAAGATTWCQRREDVADMALALSTVAPGQSVSWLQDGRARLDPGTYSLFAEWDGNKNLRSQSVRITIE